MKTEYNLGFYAVTTSWETTNQGIGLNDRYSVVFSLPFLYLCGVAPIYAIVCIYWTSSLLLGGILHYFYYRVLLGRPNWKYKNI